MNDYLIPRSRVRLENMTVHQPVKKISAFWEGSRCSDYPPPPNLLNGARWKIFYFVNSCDSMLSRRHLMHFIHLPVCILYCLLHLQHLQCIVCHLITLTIAHCIYFVHSEIHISDYPPGNAHTTLTELPRSGQDGEL